jgi:hypothetical protein
MAFPRGCSKSNSSIRKKHQDCRSDQSERRKTHSDMQHTKCFYSSVSTKKRATGEDRVVMKITGVLVDMLVDINPELYGPAMVLENRKKILYVEVLKARYGMLEAALLCGTRHSERTSKTLDLF